MTADQHAALTELRRAAAARRAADARHRAAIVAARSTGATYRAIATEGGIALGLAHAIAGRA